MTQVWFADNSNAGGNLVGLKEWWELLKQIGPSYGYYPKPGKTCLVLKDPVLMPRAEELFGEEGVKITVEGKRQIGAVIGTEEFKLKFVSEKIEKWVQDVNQLSEIAQEQPQAALSAFNVGLSQRWKFIQRTVGGIGHLFQPIEDAIRNRLLPALCGRELSDSERRLMALPYRYGGLGLLNPTETAAREYNASVLITSGLTDLICQQETDLSLFDRNAMAEVKLQMNRAKEEVFRQEFERLRWT